MIERYIGVHLFIPVAGITVVPGVGMVTAEPPACVDLDFRRDKALAGILVCSMSAPAGHRAEVCADLVRTLASSRCVRGANWMVDSSGSLVSTE